MSNYNPPPEVAAQIEDMVATAGARAEHSKNLHSVDQTQGHVKIGHDGTAHVIGETKEAARIADDGRDYQVERFNDQKRIDDLQAKLEAHTFCSKTGAKQPVVTGQLREVIELQLTSARNAAQYAETRYQAIEQQRARDAAWKAAELDERETRFRLTGGKPELEAALDKYLREEELRLGAKALLAKRFEHRQG